MERSAPVNSRWPHRLIRSADLHMSKKLLPHWGLGTWTPTELPASVYGAHMEGVNWVHMFTYGLIGHFCIQKSTAEKQHRSFLLCLSLSLFLPSSFFSLLFCVFLPPNFTFHLDISQLVTDSCSCSPPPCPSPQLVRHSAVPRRAGRSWADCTRGLGRGDHSLLSAQLVLVRWRDCPFKRQIGSVRAAICLFMDGNGLFMQIFYSNRWNL